MNYKDVALLNQSLDDLGSGLLKRKMLQEQTDQRLQQGMLGQQGIDVAKQRTAMEEQHYKTMEGKADNATSLAEQRAQLQDKQKMLQTVMMLNAGGQLQDLDSVNDWLQNDDHFGPIGLQLAKPPEPKSAQVGQNALAQAYQQANEWRTRASATEDPDEADRFNAYADDLEKWGNLQANPPPKPAAAPPAAGTITAPVPGQPGAKLTQRLTADQVQAMQPKTKPLPANVAQQFMLQAGGDPVKARALAKAQGYTF